ncbi:MAG: hypothetical protein R3174_03675 [Gammaproteobacteria bacterium]|nr:hypothetical protein [Gammaproteobacteria bacterium]
MNAMQAIAKSITAAALTAGMLSVSGAAGAGSADYRLLSEAQFREQIVGNYVEGGYRARHYRFWIGEGGVARGQLGLTGSDDGVWHIKDDLFCYEWAHYFQGVERCYYWYRSGDRVVLRNADNFRILDVHGRLLPGKPAGY